VTTDPNQHSPTTYPSRFSPCSIWTAQDSSTPKKAEDVPRHPLALLADVREAAQSIACTRRDWEGSLLERRLNTLESALRAQPEAEPLPQRSPEAHHRNGHDAPSQSPLPSGRHTAVQHPTRAQQSNEQHRKEPPILNSHASVSQAQPHVLALSARDARTSRARRAALDTLERRRYPVITRATDLQNLLALVRQDPGRPANHYAARLNLPHNDVRKLLVQLEQRGELDSKRVRVYRVALQRPGPAEDRQAHPHDDQKSKHPAARRPEGHHPEESSQLQLTQAEVQPSPLGPIRHEEPVHEDGNPVHEHQRDVPLALPVRKTHPPRPITDDQGAHAKTPEGTQ